ncbi:hypothetical protein CR513_16501, partial [Mucuna pruriens]
MDFGHEITWLNMVSIANARNLGPFQEEEKEEETNLYLIRDIESESKEEDEVILDYLGKFDSKSNKGTFLGYFEISKAYRIYNSRTLTIEESFHINFNDSKPNRELLELDDSFARLDLNMPQRSSNEVRNWQMKSYHPEQQIIGVINNKFLKRSIFKSQGQVALISEIERQTLKKKVLVEDATSLEQTSSLGQAKDKAP